MKYRIVKPENLSAEVFLPASKSISNRALVLTALSGGNLSLLTNVSDCDDTRVMLRALAMLGEKDKAVSTLKTIDIGAAGTAMRFLTALLATVPGEYVITGTERMRHRPIGILIDALRQLGADIEYVGETGFPPLHIKGGSLRGGTLRMAGNVSSQYVSALLMIAPCLEGGLHLELEGEVMSRPYIEMTMSMMRHFGAEVRWDSAQAVTVAPKAYCAAPYTIESDWSAASYWYEIVFLAEQQQETATLHGLFENSLQGDCAVADIFDRLTVKTMPLRRGYTDSRMMLIRRGAMPTRLEWDFAATPDLAQTVVVACAVRGIAFRFTGLQSLRIKETDRIAALQRELAKLGIYINEEPGGVLSWDGPQQQSVCGDAHATRYLCPACDTVIDTYDDHRMAMAFAPVAMLLGNIIINNPDVVSKSYPRFWDDLREAGFGIIEL